MPVCAAVGERNAAAVTDADDTKVAVDVDAAADHVVRRVGATEGAMEGANDEVGECVVARGSAGGAGGTSVSPSVAAYGRNGYMGDGYTFMLMLVAGGSYTVSVWCTGLSPVAA